MRKPWTDQLNRYTLAAMTLMACLSGWSVQSGFSADGQSRGLPQLKGDSLVNPVLLDYYEEFLESRDPDQFSQKVLARYNESTLIKLLESTKPETRRAAVLALGYVGGPKANAAVGDCMRDEDLFVRSFSENALWGIWFRSSNADNNRELSAIRNLVSEERIEEALKRVNKLIETAPDFAEAWNQRAIIHFTQGELDQSIADCREVIKRNPYHYGALSGMGQCLIRTGRLNDALKTFTDLLKIQPYNEAVKATIDELQRGRI
jgi:tetratricopeptide (TPR) repeat protein